MGLYSDPIFFGHYPLEIRNRCGERLPYFIPEDRIQNSIDFFSLNHYTTLEATSNYNDNYNYFTDAEISERFPDGSTPSAAEWLHVYPDGIYGMIKWLQDRYDLAGRKMELMITESGVATFPNDGVHDPLRIQYYDGYIKKALQAKNDFGIELTHYCAWAILDNFEWSSGFLEVYGLIKVDFNSPNRTRTPKESANWLRKQTFFN
jgi:beta-glucosidase/6-phospho-beta-glucosidase/beta-galactosidase